MKFFKILILLQLIISCTSDLSLKKEKPFKDDAYLSKNWTTLERCKIINCPLVSLIKSIDQIGNYYLYVSKRPKELIEKFKYYREFYFNTDAIDDELTDWISAINDLLEIQEVPINIKESTLLLKFGDDFFYRGMKVKSYDMDRLGNESLNIAQKYYLTYLYKEKFPKHKDRVLLNLGIIKSRLWYQKEETLNNFYLKEVIRKYPHTKSSKTAYNILVDNIHFSYTGSSGNFTPKSQLELLKYFKTKAIKEVRPINPIIEHGPF